MNNQELLNGALTALVNHLNAAISSASDAVPAIVVAAGKYLQMLAIANLLLGVLGWIIVLFCLYVLHSTSQWGMTPSTWLTEENKPLPEAEHNFNVGVVMWKCGLSIFFAVVALFFLGTKIFNTSNWAGAIDSRAAIVGYVLERVPGGRR